MRHTPMRMNSFSIMPTKADGVVSGQSIDSHHEVLTISDRVDVVLYGGMSDLRRGRRVAEGTHDPEQPPFHLEHRDHVTSILDHVGDEEGHQSERRVEV